MKPEELLNKYFEGETSCEEEKLLRHLFTHGEVPSELMIYRALFAHIEKESTLHRQSIQQKVHKKPVIKYLTYTLGGVAATLLLLFGIAGINRHLYNPPLNEVWIDGIRYTDQILVQKQADEAFSDVSFSKEDIFNVLFED